MPEYFSREHFRDPKIWKEEDGYYMVVGNKTDDGNRMLFCSIQRTQLAGSMCRCLQKTIQVCLERCGSVRISSAWMVHMY